MLASRLLVALVSAALALSPCRLVAADARPSAKVTRYVEKLMREFDADHSGGLEKGEWSSLKGNPQQADRNGDGVLSPAELTNRILGYGQSRHLRLLDAPQTGATAQPPDHKGKQTDAAGPATNSVDPSPVATEKETADPQKKPELRRDTKYYVSTKHLPENLPEWFRTRDRNGDGQLSLSEYAATGSEADTTEFQKLDCNNDGLLIPREVTAPPATKPDREKVQVKKPATVN